MTGLEQGNGFSAKLSRMLDDRMSTSLQLQINGQPRSVAANGPAPLSHVLEMLELRGDRIAVEHNGEIVPRNEWSKTGVRSGDRLEIVHFVGGGAI